jgi:hypothetical protein
VSEADPDGKVGERPPATSPATAAAPPATTTPAAAAAPPAVATPTTAVTPATAANTQPAAAPAAVAAVPPQPRCLDCGTLLEGKYCIACGQRAQLRNLSMPSLAHDAIHDLAHFDSRGWVTLRALLLKPGFLTNEFLHGRRTRYLPPFRLYLVLSLVFFVVLSFKPKDEVVVIGADAAGEPSGVVTGADPEAIKEAMKDLERELGSEAASGAKAQAAAKTAAAVSQAVADPDASLFEGAECKDMQYDGAGESWLEPRLLSICEHLKGVSKRQFGRELARNVPKMMFLFLPLLACVNLLLYAFRRRKYVEHLLFYVHFHAFAFLLLTLQMLLGMILGWIGVAFVGGLLAFAVSIYLFVALFKSMRTVYGQSRLLTTLKYVVVLMAYAFFSMVTLFGTVFYTAITV